MVDCEVTEERREKIRTLYYQGKGQRATARIVGISQPAVRKHLLKLGLLPRKDNGQPNGYMSLVLKKDECVIIKTRKELNALTQNYVAQCLYCKGFYITSRNGQIYCCNAYSGGKPCTCGAVERARLIISRSPFPHRE